MTCQYPRGRGDNLIFDIQGGGDNLFFAKHCNFESKSRIERNICEKIISKGGGGGGTTSFLISKGDV